MKSFKLKNKNGISPVVATALLLVIAVVSVVGFQNWFGNFSTTIFEDVEMETSSSSESSIEGLVGDKLYVKSGDNLSISSIKINDVDCEFSGNVSGVEGIDVSSCLKDVSGKVNIVVVSNNKIIESYEFIENDEMISESYFISEWTVPTSGSGFSEIDLPLESDGVYDFTIDWGDGTVEYINNYMSAAHIYVSDNNYTIKINGTIKGFRFNNLGYKNSILSISNWGPLNLGNKGRYFYGCSKLEIFAKDELDLTGTTDLSNMFNGAQSLSQPLNFKTSEVTNMSGMFAGTILFNQPLSFDTSKVIDMSGMFFHSNFNNSLNFNTSSVSSMSHMFDGAMRFNQNLSGWCVTNINSEPLAFALFAPLESENKPVWNSCPSN